MLRSMKKIIPILLLLFMACQLSVSMFIDSEQIKLVQCLDEKKEKGEKEEKKEFKEFVSLSSSISLSDLYKNIFFVCEVTLVPWPLAEFPILPPDVEILL